MHISQSKLLKWALYANTLYIFCLFIFMPKGLSFGKITISGFLVFSILSFVLVICMNWHKLSSMGRFTRWWFYLLLFYSIIVIIRSFSLSLQDWITNFGNVYMALAWLTPLLLVVGFNIESWKALYKAVNFMLSLMLFALVLYILGLKSPTEEWNWLFRPINFILLTVFYKYKLLSKLKVILLILIYCYIAIYTKFRFEFLYLFTVVFFLCVDKLSGIELKRIILKYILISFIIILTFIFTLGYETFSNFISNIVEYQDSRTFLFTELFSDLSKNEVYFGRGSLGSYYSDFFERTRRYYDLNKNEAWAGDVADRITIEVGYLQMILKGGFVMMFFYSALGAYASYVAIFKSNNKFVKRLGFYITIILILSIISLRPAFTPTFIIFWMAIGTVCIKKNRSMNDDEISNLLNKE